MNTPTSGIRSLARRLIAFEVAHAPSDGLVGGSVRTCDKLRVPLAKLAGVAGFRSLLARAKALATAEMPCLELVQVRVDCSLEGFDAVSAQHSAVQAGEAGVAIVVQLLELLVTFIGEPLTRQLVRDAWPDTPVTGTGSGSGAGIGDES